MSTTVPLFTSRSQVDRLHDEMLRKGFTFTDRQLDAAMLYGVEAVAAEDDEPFRYDFEFGDATWERMLPAVLAYLEVEYDDFVEVAA